MYNQYARVKAGTVHPGTGKKKALMNKTGRKLANLHVCDKMWKLLTHNDPSSLWTHVMFCKENVQDYH